MRRRTLLSAVATTTTAGCLGSVLSFSGGSPNFAIDNDPTPDGLPATLSAKRIEKATANHPPRLRVTFKSTADARRTFRFGYPGPFADTVGVAESGDRLVLRYEADPGGTRDDCWQGRTLSGQGATEHRTLDSGERAYIEWSVLSHVENESCFPRGRYRFEDEYGVGDETYEWGFWLRIR